MNMADPPENGLAADRQGLPLEHDRADDGPCLDEVAGFSERQVAFLASRHVVFLTDMALGEGRFGTIVAASFDEARRIAAARGHGETVIGLMGFGFLASLRNLVMRKAHAAPERMSQLRSQLLKRLHARRGNGGVSVAILDPGSPRLSGPQRNVCEDEQA